MSCTMKKTVLLLISITSLFLSCDPVYKVKMNGVSEILMQTDCGRLEISFQGFMGTRTYLNIKVIDGQFDVHTDSLKLRTTPQREISDMNFILNKQEVKGLLTLKAKDHLRCRFTSYIIYTSHPDYESRRIELLPGNFLLCNDKPVINDTIRIIR